MPCEAYKPNIYPFFFCLLLDYCIHNSTITVSVMQPRSYVGRGMQETQVSVLKYLIFPF
jgi:hypothetical protein